ncbi:hypothetical protein, partial [Stomatohabitans albus]|uniref:hypothetical protein n=1 Tax=Stomatohabitans albus TaxID=3110766 RepID=UPI00300CC544
VGEIAYTPIDVVRVAPELLFNLNEAIEKRDQLAKQERQTLASIPVRTTRKNYEKASEALNTDEKVFNDSNPE